MLIELVLSGGDVLYFLYGIEKVMLLSRNNQQINFIKEESKTMYHSSVILVM